MSLVDDLLASRGKYNGYVEKRGRVPGRPNIVGDDAILVTLRVSKELVEEFDSVVGPGKRSMVLRDFMERYVHDSRP